MDSIGWKLMRVLVTGGACCEGHHEQYPSCVSTQVPHDQETADAGPQP